MINITFIFMSPSSHTHCVDYTEQKMCKQTLSKPTVFEVETHLLSEDKGDHSEQLSIDLQWPFSLKG